MKNREKETIIEKFEEIYKYLIAQKFAPKLHVMDNECSKFLTEFIENGGTKIQLVEPHQHRVNAAERAIQTFKNHFIAGLCTVHPQFPLQLWCELLPHAELTLNLLQQARSNNKLSAYTVLEGEFNFDKTPLAPPGTKALVFDDPKKTYIVGTACEGRMVCRPCYETLSLFQILHTINKRFSSSTNREILPKLLHNANAYKQRICNSYST